MSGCRLYEPPLQMGVADPAQVVAVAAVAAAAAAAAEAAAVPPRPRRRSCRRSCNCGLHEAATRPACSSTAQGQQPPLFMAENPCSLYSTPYALPKRSKGQANACLPRLRLYPKNHDPVFSLPPKKLDPLYFPPQSRGSAFCLCATIGTAGITIPFFAPPGGRHLVSPPPTSLAMRAVAGEAGASTSVYVCRISLGVSPGCNS
mmetsp:Transcript_24873/g.62559  ORF Transcript_24873/g.62559 Transcript_24873/m.62559 type:complete len:203 (+) Transcript_24873:1281-1889(+)